MAELEPTGEDRREIILKRSPLLRGLLSSNLGDPSWYDSLEEMVSERAKDIDDVFEWEFNVVPALTTLVDFQDIFDGLTEEEISNIVKCLTIIGSEIGRIYDIEFMSHEVSTEFFRHGLVKKGVEAELVGGTVMGLMVNGMELSSKQIVINLDLWKDGLEEDEAGYLIEALSSPVQDPEPLEPFEPEVKDSDAFSDFVNRYLKDGGWLDNGEGD